MWVISMPTWCFLCEMSSTKRVHENRERYSLQVRGRSLRTKDGILAGLGRYVCDSFS